MSLNFEALNKISPSQRDLVFGYLREYESILNQDDENNPFYTIPDLIIYITLSYYMFEYFKLYPEIIKAPDDHRTVTRCENSNIWHNVCYSATEINPAKDKCSYQWIVKIESMKDCLLIGFGSDYETPNVISLHDTQSAYYLLHPYSGRVDGTGNKQVDAREYMEYGSVKSGDTICLEFSCYGDKSYIKYYVNDVDKGVAFSADEINMDNNITYRMAVSLCDAGDSVTITDLKCLAIEQ